MLNNNPQQNFKAWSEKVDKGRDKSYLVVSCLEDYTNEKSLYKNLKRTKQ